MKRLCTATITAWVLILAAMVVAQAQQFERPDPNAADPVERGAYILRAGGCDSCHTDHPEGGAHLAGGGPIKTEFGVFYGPNITPDLEHGLGAWTYDDFKLAMTWGIAPDGAHYYPAFPYSAYTRMRETDLADLWTYLNNVKPVSQADRPHALNFPYSLRPATIGWKLMFFRPALATKDLARSEEWNRGAYLVEALGHCGECHTPRNILGAKRIGLAMAGTEDGVDDTTVPNITPDAATGIGDWSVGDIVFLLRLGFTPEGDDVQAGMGMVVSHGTGHLTDEDLKAMAVYLKSLPPIDNEITSAIEEETYDTIDEW